MKLFFIVLASILMLIRSYELAPIYDDDIDEHVDERYNYEEDKAPHAIHDPNEMKLLRYQDGAYMKAGQNEDKNVRVGPVSNAYLIFNGKLSLNGGYKNNQDGSESQNGRNQKILNDLKHVIPNYVAIRKNEYDNGRNSAFNGDRYGLGINQFSPY
jgi:hypothetical protein